MKEIIESKKKLKNSNPVAMESEFVMDDLPSTLRNLEVISLSLVKHKAVLIEGLVGSGKTSLIEHLAHVNGKNRPPYFTKIQLGDQTDGKMLLGTYSCTAIPGEFVWNPGSLTLAVNNGYWLLLEDIDYAPMDVLSILAHLLESSTLFLPGYGNLEVHKDFQLFATRRIYNYGSRLMPSFLEKYFSRITLEMLTKEELLKLISKKWPKLNTIKEKLVGGFVMLNGDIDTVEDSSANMADISALINYGRLVSIRDLMKWCSRISVHYETESKIDLAERAFQEAMDCFCAAVSDQKKKYVFAQQIGSYMNRTKLEVEYFLNQYKPDIKSTSKYLFVGNRVKLNKQIAVVGKSRIARDYTFSFTRQACCLLERVAVAVHNREPVLIVGETGTGKTATVQYLASQTSNILNVINMNQQSDSADLVGGFKPMELKTILFPIRQEFEVLFSATFSFKKNTKFLHHVMTSYVKQNWNVFFALLNHTSKNALQRLKKPEVNGNFNSLTGQENITKRWKELQEKLIVAQKQSEKANCALAFNFIDGTLIKAIKNGRYTTAVFFRFIDGTLIKAIKNGEWVLLDEINLAAAETLECLSGLLESQKSSIILLEKGDKTPVGRHPNFRLFACMNPATDIGKKELPAGLRNRFTEFFMEELSDKQDLQILINDYLISFNPSPTLIHGIQDFYLQVKDLSHTSLVDGIGQKPHFSLRSLCRALHVASKNVCGNFTRSLFEAFCLSFLTQLDGKSYEAVYTLIKKQILCFSKKDKLLLCPISKPKDLKCIEVEGYFIAQGDAEPEVPGHYILTSTVRRNLKDLSRIISIGGFPVLLQGETSVGKTSLIIYLAKLTGNICFRINNHEHTDIQEYVGSYMSDIDGKLVFKEGILVQAMRAGHWIILDELNLAPSDVLEALNRLLDDNRELFITETQETVKAHPRFMLFATQNPAGYYGGRKVLSRAFRNRFIELHFTEIPPKELETILHERCEIPLSYSKKMVFVLRELQNMRRTSNLFQGKQSFITLRDLFRWARRYQLAAPQTSKFYDWEQHIADEGYLVLASKVRIDEEDEVIRNVIEKQIKRKVVKENLFKLSDKTSPVTKSVLEKLPIVNGFEHIVWTEGMLRLYVFLGKAFIFKEPVLLVGETGCGKTTVCQLIAAASKQQLFTVNCHMHTEGSDFIGGLRPVRRREENNGKLFEWVDGPLIKAMIDGGFFLVDEISLADDSVLERLNSVLESERTLVVAEKASLDEEMSDSSPEVIEAHSSFCIAGTMNPGGDYGKKELSPALRNRFTEIWCPKIDISEFIDDALLIIEHNVEKGVVLNESYNDSGIARAMLHFLKYFKSTNLGKKCTVSIRDLLAWVSFINISVLQNAMSVSLSYIHGAYLVLLDGLGSGATGTGSEIFKELKKTSSYFLLNQIWQLTHHKIDMVTISEDLIGEVSLINSADKIGIGPFVIQKGKHNSIKPLFLFEAHKTCINLVRLLRGLQLDKPILLEGSPGVGKTSLVIALAKASANHIVRINLSEHTDISDLFGADLPMEGEGGKFVWCDGPLLHALKKGSWVVFDELNLASQSVLEGLNACFDHRGEIFIPELGQSFIVEHRKTKIFACQNPLYQGGARKGLPKSFLNRFTQVHVEPLQYDDYIFILRSLYCHIPEKVLENMVTFNEVLVNELLIAGGDRLWDFNLRDMFRWCDIMVKYQSSSSYNPGDFVVIVYGNRMRETEQREKVYELYKKIFDEQLYPIDISQGPFHINKYYFQVGHAFLKRSQKVQEVKVPDLSVLHSHLPILESLIFCIEMNWTPILVGPSKEGKSSIIKLLAFLAGKKLRTVAANSEMDTTELLGSFEQVDFGRRLGDMIEEVEELLCACDGMSKTKVWIKIIELRKDRSSKSTSEEYTDFIEQCDLLLNMLNSIEKLASLTSLVKELKSQVESSGSVKVGGTFEWVDSVLVKAVQYGHWVLLDGANICPASVLDRLNELLEPGGVLQINEKGSVNGLVPCIEPHPDFRLFLTMDPTFGEVSRPMRNRCIEIYIHNIWNNNFDVRALLIKSGLNSPHLQHAVLKAHRAICNVLPVYEKLHITEAVDAAHSVRQLQDTGLEPGAALQKALLFTYVSSQNVPEKRQKIKETLLNISVLDESENILWPPFEDMIFRTTWLKNGDCDCSARLLFSILQTVALAQSSPNYISSWCSCILPFPALIPVSQNSLRLTFIITLLATPKEEWVTMQNLIQKLDFVYNEIFLSVCSSEIFKYKEIIKDLPSYIPCDPRYNCIEAKKVCDYVASVGYSANKIFLEMWCSVFYKFCKLSEDGVSVESLGPKVKRRKINKFSVLQISESVNSGVLNCDQTIHKSIVYLNPLFNLLDSFLLSLFKSDTNICDNEFVHLRSSLNWKERFYKICLQALLSTENLIFQIAFHWSMLKTEFFAMIPNSWNKFVPSQLFALSDELDRCLSVHCGNIHALASAARVMLKPPKPFTTAEDANCNSILLKLSDFLALRPCKKESVSYLASEKGKALCLNTLKAFTEGELCDAKTLENALCSISEEAKELYDSLSSKEMQVLEMDVTIWPFLDYLLGLGFAWSRTSELIGFDSTAHLIAYPLQLYKKLDHNFIYFSVNFYSFLSSCSSLKYTSIWLTYSFNEEILEEKSDLTIFYPSLALLSLILSGSDLIYEIPISISKEKKCQLCQVNATLWNNWNLLKDDKCSFTNSYVSYIFKFSVSFFTALASAFQLFSLQVNNYAQMKSVIKVVYERSKAIFPADIVSLFEQLLLLFESLECIENNTEMEIICICKIGIYISILQVWLLSHFEPLDPVEKAKVLFNYYKEEVDDLEAELLIHRFVMFMKGLSMEEDNNKLSHPHYSLIKSYCKEVEKEKTELGKVVAYRPSSNLYYNLIDDVNHLIDSLFNINKFQEIIQCKDSLESSYVASILVSLETFIEQTYGRYLLFRDLTMPILQAIATACESLRIIVYFMKIQNLLGHCNQMKSLISFPYVLIENKKQKILDNIHYLQQVFLKNSDEVNTKKWIIYGIQISYIELLNNAIWSGSLNLDDFGDLSELLDKVLVYWKKQKDEEVRKIEEEESLFIYKTRSLGEEDSEEELLEKDFKETFPEYEYEDFEEGESSKKLPITVPELSINDALLEELNHVHYTLLTCFTSSVWRKRNKSKIKEEVPLYSVLRRMQLLQAILKINGPYLPEDINRNLFESTIMFNYALSLSLGQQMPSVVCKPYNIYRDPNPKEIMKVELLLSPLKEEVSELLIEWPNHPALLSVSTVTERVLNFSLNSPLMKVVVGLETVLEKAQVWEEFAHHNISLCEHLIAITHQVIEWRKMELESWKACLQDVSEKFYSSGLKWWPYLYEMLIQLRNSENIDNFKVFLKQFIESSPIGEYESRLKLLFTIHCHADMMLKKFKVCKQLKLAVSVTWNLFSFYCQFSVAIATHLLTLRKTVEKDVKEFVKIARWNDINFYSVRDSVSKCRRTLHKHMKKWEKILQKPVSSMLKDTESDKDLKPSSENEKKGSSIQLGLLCIPFSLPKQDDDVFINEGGILNKLPRYLYCCHKFMSSIMKNFVYEEKLEYIEDLTVDIIQTYHHLQALALEANAIINKSKKVKLLKNVMQQRREGLNRLVRTLFDVGVSHNKGIALWRDDYVDSFLTIEPIDITIAHQNVPSLKTACHLWPSIEKYYFKSIAHFSVVISALNHPHADLSTEIIKKLRGISYFFMVSQLKLRRNIAFVSTNLQYYRKLIKSFSSTSQNLVASSELYRHWHKTIQEFAANLNRCVSESKLLLSSYTVDKSLIVLNKNVSVLSNALMEEAVMHLASVQSDLKKIIFDLAFSYEEDSEVPIFVTELKVENLRTFSVKLNGVCLGIEKTVNLVCQNQNKETSFLHSLQYYLDQWCNIKTSFNHWVGGILVTEHDNNVESGITSEVESCITNVLLSVERFYKGHCGDELIQEEDNDSSSTPLLSEAIIKMIVDDVERLNLPKVIYLLKSILYSVKPKCTKVLLYLQKAFALFKHYEQLCENTLAVMVGTLRSVSKMFFIMLIIFQHLATNGFCRPADLDDESENDNENDGQFKVCEGTGLGEGEGQKEVSDRIQSEDQLESALKEGEEELPGDANVAEEDTGIEMSEDFQGQHQEIKNRNESDKEDNDNDNTNELDKEMGKTEKDSEKLDERLWGEDEEEVEDKNEELQDEEGFGNVDKSRSELLAKKDRAEIERKDKEKPEEYDEDPREKFNEEEECAIDDNFVDPLGGEGCDPDIERENELFDVPEDLKLSGGEESEGEDENNPLEIEEKGLFPGEESEDNKDVSMDEDREVNEDKNDEHVSMNEEANINEDSEKTNDEQNGEVEEKLDGTHDDKEGDNPTGSMEQQKTHEVAQEAPLDTKGTSQDFTKDKKEAAGSQHDIVDDQEKHGETGETADDVEGAGQSDSCTKENAHEAISSSLVAEGSSEQKISEKPSNISEDRTLGNNRKDFKKGLMSKETSAKESEENKDEDTMQNGDEFQHVTQAIEELDTQVVDAATLEQAHECPAASKAEDAEKYEEVEAMDVDEEEAPQQSVPQKEPDILEETGGTRSRKDNDKSGELRDKEDDIENITTEGSAILESLAERPPEAYFHTLLEAEEIRLAVAVQEHMEETRIQLQEQSKGLTINEEGIALWTEHEAKVSHLALQLCEQLRLILEPTRASKLKGDFRTGKRINMRKVIPYIASHFRKDKIWLRRIQPNKRDYHILLAVDDSLSMAEVKASSLAYQSVALVTRALTLLEAGQVGVVSFGSETKVLHPLDQPFSDTAGAHIMSNLTFKQEETNFDKLLRDSYALLTSAKANSGTSRFGNPETSQLLLILSDGQTHARSKMVKTAVKIARDSKIFIVFIVLDATGNQYSFYDILVWEDGTVKPLVETFPFPFFLVVRDMAGLPDALATALKQWFELVTADSQR